MRYDYSVSFGKRLLILLLTFVIWALGSLLTQAAFTLLPLPESVPGTLLFYTLQYGLGAAVLVLLFRLIKPLRPITDALTKKMQGNTGKMIVIGLAAGAVLSILIALLSAVSDDMNAVWNPQNAGWMLLGLIPLALQCFSEELECRVILYQGLRRTFRHAWIAVVVSSLVFCFNHMSGNITAVLETLSAGFVFALLVYCFDSTWLAVAYHVGWNLIFLFTGDYTEGVGLFQFTRTVPEPDYFFQLDTSLSGELPIFLLNLVLIAVILIVYSKKKKTV